MGYEWASKCQHISFGMIQGMSTRKGTSVFLEQILDEAKDTMHEQMQKTAEKYAQIEDPHYTSDVLGMSAVKIQVSCESKASCEAQSELRRPRALSDRCI